MAKRALQVAAAGGHGVLMGAAGSGKTMLASRLPSILPPLTEARAQAAVVHSVAGEDPGVLAGCGRFAARTTRRAGGSCGRRLAAASGRDLACAQRRALPRRAGRVRPSVLQGIRQPLEAGRVVVTRADGNVEFPARFMLVAASNPCPCGYFGDPRSVHVHQRQIRAYQGRVGGPVMDRIDVHIDVRRIPPGEVLATGGGASSEELRRDVLRAREFASWRRARADGAEGGSPEGLVRACGLADEDEAFLEDMARAGRMSGRAIMRTLALARTIADMEERARVGRAHLCEAVGFRLREVEREAEGPRSSGARRRRLPGFARTRRDPRAALRGGGPAALPRASPSWARARRRPTARLRAEVRRIAAGGASVVSGGARGCDAAAHAPP